MKVQDWIVSLRYGAPGVSDFSRYAVVGPARASTVESVFHLAHLPMDIRTEIRAEQTVRDFIDARLDPSRTGYYVQHPILSEETWVMCIGPVHEVIRSGLLEEDARIVLCRKFIAEMALTARQTAIGPLDDVRLQMLHEIHDAARDLVLPDWYPLKDAKL